MKTNNLTNQEPMDWEKAFDREFYVGDDQGVHSKSLEYWNSKEKLKKFISKWLQQERVEFKRDLLELNSRLRDELFELGDTDCKYQDVVTKRIFELRSVWPKEHKQTWVPVYGFSLLPDRRKLLTEEEKAHINELKSKSKLKI